jgi:NADPH2:quinone reductase
MKEPRDRVVQVRRFGGPGELEVVDAPLPIASRGEVRARVLASGLEYTDVLIRRHLYPQTMRRRPPFIMGYDAVGEIDQLGAGVSGFRLGDRVADMTVVGSNAAYLTLRADRLTRLPAGLDPVEAATLILSWTTAYQLLHRAARVQRGNIRSTAIRTTISSKCQRSLGRGRRWRSRRAIAGPNFSTQRRTGISGVPSTTRARSSTC